MSSIIQYYFNLAVAERTASQILLGFIVTIQMSVLIVCIGIGLGLVLSVVRSYRIKIVTQLVVLFADVFRAIPELVILVFIYFAFPYLGITLSPFVSTVVGLSLVLAAFAEEIFWAGITSVPVGQWEAARSTGLTFGQTLRHVIMPQAVRLGIPPLVNRTIAITKATSLGSVIAAQELLGVVTSVQSVVANPTPYLMGTVLYLLLFLPFVRLSRRLERRLSYWER